MSHLVSVIDEDGLWEYYATSQPIETNYYSVVAEDSSPQHNTGFIFFACTLGVFASILWIGAIVMSLRLKRRRELIARQERIELEMSENSKKREKKLAVTAAILSRKITNITDDGRIIELSDWRHEEASKTFVSKEDLAKKEYSNVEDNHSNGGADLSSEKKAPADTSDEEVSSLWVNPVETNNEDSDLENQKDNDVEKSENTFPERDENVLNCSICLTPFRVGDELSWSRELKCRHVFHKECLVPWLMKNNECPFCRENIVNDSNSTKEGKGEECNFITYPTNDGKENLVSDATTDIDGKENLNFLNGNILVIDGLISIVQNEKNKFTKNVQKNSKSILDDAKNNTSYERLCPDRDQQDHVNLRKGCRRKKRISRKTYTAVTNDENDSVV